MMVHEQSREASRSRARRRIRVLYVCTALDRGSGGEMHPIALAEHLDRDRFDFEVAVIEQVSERLLAEFERYGRRVHVLRQSRRLYNPVGLLRIVHCLYRLCRQRQPDIVQTHAWHANLLGRPAARLAGVRTIVATETAGPETERNALRRVLNSPLHGVNRLLDRRTEQIVVVSEFMRRWKDPATTSTKVRVITPPFRLNAFEAASNERAWSERSIGRAVVLGMVGRLSAEKGHRFLIAAMPEILAGVPSARLLIVGSGPLETKLRAQAVRLGVADRVRFLGYVRDVQTVYAQMDVLVVPSLADSCPLVVLEGMTMGLPIVGARTGGIAEMVVDAETGLLVPPCDSTALAQACRYLSSHPAVGREMGERGRERVLREFHPSKFIARHEDLYACAVASQR